MADDRADVDLGTCCMCEGRNGVRNVLMLDRKAAVPGHGWGCLVCGLPSDGASAVLCDPCFKRYQSGAAELRFLCRGYPATDGREPYRRAVPDDQRFECDVTKHPEVQAMEDCHGDLR